jgi:hypothetical protein
VRNEEVLHGDKEEGNILQTTCNIRRRKANWTAYMLCGNCLMKVVIEGKLGGMIQATGRQGRRRKQLLNDIKEIRGCCKLK